MNTPATTTAKPISEAHQNINPRFTRALVALAEQFADWQIAIGHAGHSMANHPSAADMCGLIMSRAGVHCIATWEILDVIQKFDVSLTPYIVFNGYPAPYDGSAITHLDLCMCLTDELHIYQLFDTWKKQ